MSEELDEKSVQDYIDSDPSSEQQPEETEQVETPEPETEDQKGEEEEEKSGVPKGVQKRIDSLTADKHRLKSAVEEKERKLAEYEAKLQSYEKKDPERPQKPSLEQFDWDEVKYEEAKDKYYEDLADWKTQQRLGEYEQKGAVNNILTKKKDIEKQHAERVQKAGIEDYAGKVNEVINAFEKENLIIPDSLIESIQLDENGPKIVEYFSGNTKRAIEISKMGTVQAALEIGKISAKISNGKPLQQTKAPKPVIPLKGSGSKSIDKEKLSVDDWVNMPAEQLGLDR